MRLRAVLVTTVVMVSLAFAGMVVFYVLSEQRARAQESQRQLAAIRAERTRYIRESCLTTNRRHDNTVHTLERVLLAHLTSKPVDPATPPALVLQRLKAEGTPDTATTQRRTALLVQALAPKRDCAAVVRRRTGP